MKHFKFALYIFIVSNCFTSCSLDKKDIINQEWKYGEGYHLGDVIKINDSDIINDTLFGTTIIYKTVNRPYADDILYIRLIKTGETGIYFGKWNN